MGRVKVMGRVKLFFCHATLTLGSSCYRREEMLLFTTLCWLCCVLQVQTSSVIGGGASMPQLLYYQWFIDYNREVSQNYTLYGQVRIHTLSMLHTHIKTWPSNEIIGPETEIRIKGRFGSHGVTKLD